jgi:hypothetical protein
MALKLSHNQKIAVFVPIIVVFLTSIITFIAYEVNRPYIQYEQGQYYKSGAMGITSLRLKNEGYSDAEDILVNASFAGIITDVTVGDPSLSFSIKSGGRESRFVVCNISRLVPSQEAYIYFANNNQEEILGEGKQNFVKQITFRGGTGRVGDPWYRLFLPSLGGILIGSLFTYLYERRVAKFRAERDHYKDELDEWGKFARELSGELKSTNERLRENLKTKPDDSESTDLDKEPLT